MREIWIIFRKELKEVLRDRRTLVFMIALPLLMIPALGEVAVYFTVEAQRRASTEVLRYAVFDEHNLPAVTEAFTQAPRFERVTLARREDITAAVAAGTIDFALVVNAANTGSAVAGKADPAGPQTLVALHFDDSVITDKIEERARAVLDALSERERARRLTAVGVPEATHDRLLTPVRVMKVGTADMRAIFGERLGGMLPYLFIVFCLLGALYPAIDLAAGEKERGTLETLLLVPVARGRIVLGKYLVVFTTAMTAAALSLVSLGAWAAWKGRAVQGAFGAILSSIGALDLALIAAMLVPVAAMFAAILLSISIYARSFKEAQSYAAPMNLLVILPAMLAMLPGVEMTWGWAMVPITNIALAVKELVKGTMNYEMLVAILGSSALLAGLLLAFCTWWFRRESVLFRA
ncbi:MAG TPA: ABC transporter permease subunit [Haliangium sp.]|nr:ABC transporter permease subunit [Haliangium sp.]